MVNPQTRRNATEQIARLEILGSSLAAGLEVALERLKTFESGRPKTAAEAHEASLPLARRALEAWKSHLADLTTIAELEREGAPRATDELTLSTLEQAIRAAEELKRAGLKDVSNAIVARAAGEWFAWWEELTPVERATFLAADFDEPSRCPPIARAKLFLDKLQGLSS